MKKFLKIFLISLAVLVVVFIVVIIANMAMQHKKLQQGECSFSAGIDTIPFTYSSSGHILVQISINGSKTTYPFVLDCGASNFVFSHKVKALNLPKNGKGMGIGAKGNFFLTNIRKIETLTLGKAVFTDLNANESEFNSTCPDQAYGLIGTGVMHHLDWQIDFKKRIIIVADSKNKFQFSKDTVAIPLSCNKFSNHLSVNVKFGKNKKSHSILVDTGNSGALAIKEDKIKEDSLQLKFSRIFGVGSKGLGSENKDENEKIYLVDTMYFSGTHYIIHKIPAHSTAKSLDLLGLSFFENYKTTISWKSNLLILEPNTDNPQFAWETFGLRLDYNEQSRKVFISSITEHTSAYEAKVPLHAEVISANNVPLTNRESLCTFLSDTTGKTLDLVLRVNGAPKTFRLNRRLVIQ